MRVFALSLLLGACATTTPPRMTPRVTESSDDSDAALEAATPNALRCLGPRDRVTVEGFFDGPSGRFLVERLAAVSPTTSVRTQQCVNLAMERAHMRPFAAPRLDARWTVAPPDTRPTTPDRPTLAGDERAPSGEIDPAAVMAVLRAEAPEAQRCYEDALRGAPSLRGRVEVRFTLSVDGRITEAVASGPRGFRAVGHCILGHLRGLSWPPARGGSVDFVFPYQFAPRP